MRNSVCAVFAKAILLFSSCLLVSVLSLNAAQATVINFDDLDYTIIEDGDGDMFYEHPVTDQYLSKGLLIGNGYLAEYDENDPNIASSPNLLIGSADFLTLSFVGSLPTFVGMKVRGALNGDASFFDVYTASGLIMHARTGGDAHSPDDPPYIPNEFISFIAPQGISEVRMSNSYGRRIVGGIDDLVYEYASVPEPSPLLLLEVGVFGLVLRRIFLMN